MPTYRFQDIAINGTEKVKAEDIDISKYIGLEHLESGSLFVKKWGSDVPIKGEKLVMHKGDVLFGKRNTYLKRAAIAPHDGAFSAHGMILRPKEDVIDKDFFPLFIASDYFFDAAIRISVGSLSPTVNWKDLKNLEFNIPSISEQQKLAKLLWAINDTKEAYKDLIQETRELVKARFIELFGTIDQHPNDCKVVTIESVCSLIKDGTHQTPQYTNDKEFGYKFLSSKDVMSEKIDWSDIKYIPAELHEKLYKTIRPQRNDILMSKNGVHYGVAAVNDTDEIFDIYVSLALLRPLSIINPVYFRCALNNQETQNQFNSRIKGIGVPDLHLGEIKKTEILLPPIERQMVLVSTADQADKSISALNKSIQELDSMYKRIIRDNLG
ncbi:MAG: restriction endonuclease subunit S [Lachnospiraceae bacterium]|jgi:type I restriction enzyme S subunit|nr:restriction endonuclease subunit S [Lachnospiraceae bacterium]MCH4067261.1 restriction endonuclease subunit S [Lachnospiraceae bacterium]MCH4113286.1 restriction endonuclease subunit S [Lachnospiraceae bacterium]